MSTKATIILTDDDEHIYNDYSDRIIKGNKEIGQGIVLEFSRKNIKDYSDDEDVIISLEKYSDLFNRLNSLFSCKEILKTALKHIKTFTEAENRNAELEVLIERTLYNIDR